MISTPTYLRAHVVVGNQVLAKKADVTKQLEQSQDIMDSQAVCEMFRISPQQLYLMRRDHQFPSHKPMGKRLFFFKDEIREWLKTYCYMPL